MVATSDLEVATDVFVQAFCKGRSRTYPYVSRRHEGLWIMEDNPPRKKPRKTEVISCGLSPDQTLAALHSAAVSWHFLCAIEPNDGDHDAIRAAYKDAGYRLLATQWMFVHDLHSIPELQSDPPARLVSSNKEWQTIPQRAKQPRRLTPGNRLFGIWDDVIDYGWVESVPIGKHAWVSGLHVHIDCRGQGRGAALMSQMLLGDREAGTKSSVLIASTAGARLYPHLGYRQIGVLHMMCPKAR
ncbi:MAG: hypothetical protein HONBIEJF_00255 [Fimbriimonadaceae bacterium]|nr:hypothetical protein [Fimbriimonadaceae bacterium]